MQEWYRAGRGGLRRAAPCASRVGTGRGRVAGGPGGGPGEAQPQRACSGELPIASKKNKKHGKSVRQEKRSREERGRAQERPRVRVRSSKRRTAVRFVRGCTVHASRVRVHVLMDCMDVGRTRALCARPSSGFAGGCSGRSVPGRPPRNASGVAAMPGPCSVGSRVCSGMRMDYFQKGYVDPLTDWCTVQNVKKLQQV